MISWLPEKRSTYNAKRREKDLNLVYDNWHLPEDMTCATINLADVPNKVAKKHRRVVAIHGHEWLRKNSEFCDKNGGLEARGEYKESRDLCLKHSESTLAQMRAVLPRYQSKTIIDIPADFRKFGTEICGREISGSNGSAINFLYWNNYRLAVYHNGEEGEGIANNDELCLHYANKALSLLPKLQHGEIPHYDEMKARVLRALAIYLMKDYEAALTEYRVCLAAIRLLDHAGRVDMSDPNDSLMRLVNVWPHTIIRMVIKIKIQNGESRPFFTKDEQLDLMKENAYGIYSPSSRKCINCGEKENLSLCSGCKSVWLCGKSCAKEAWRAGHKHSCGTKPYTGDIMGEVPAREVVPYAMPAFTLQNVLSEVEEDCEGSLGISMLNMSDRNFLVLCRDPRSGEIFDALTDQAFKLLAGTTFARGSSWGRNVHFHCVTDDRIGSNARSEE